MIAIQTTRINDEYGSKVSEVVISGKDVLVERFGLDSAVQTANEHGRVMVGSGYAGSILQGERVRELTCESEEEAATVAAEQIEIEKKWAATL
jgi:hypothetical protein